MGSNVIYRESCHSTNDLAVELIHQAGTSEGSVVITSHQVAGKGQRGNSWEADPYMNLTFSIILRPTFLPAQKQFYLNMVTSLAIHHLLTQSLAKKVSIKWPNDIYCENKKLCGILIQNILKGSMISASVIGIGLNVNQLVFNDVKASSMAALTSKTYDLPDLFSLLLVEVEKQYLLLRELAFQKIEEEYTKAMFWYGEKRKFQAGKVFEGLINGVDEMGRLKIMTDHGCEVFDLKEIQFLI